MKFTISDFFRQTNGRISMFRARMTSDLAPVFMKANLTDKEAATRKRYFPLWEPGTQYEKDWIVRYGNDLYRIGQSHTSQEQWVPGELGTEALYSKIMFNSQGYEIWKAWDGVSGSYTEDQIVEDPNNGMLYISTTENNVWGPPSEQSDFWTPYYGV